MFEALPAEEQKRLRAAGVLNESEIAIRCSDVVVALNALTATRRPIDVSSTLSESRRLLKD